MLLQDIFSKDRIVVDLESEDKDEVFEELTDSLVRSYKFSNRDEILAAIHDRESKMSTGIKTGIAIPHGKTDAVSGVCGAFGISRKGIDYDALDGKPVYLLFLLVSSTSSYEIHLKILRRLAILLENPRFYQDIMSVKTPEEAHRILQKYEEILGFQES